MKIVAIIFYCVLLISCRRLSSGCIKNTTNYVSVGLYKYIIDTVAHQVAYVPDSLTMLLLEAGPQDTFYNKVKYSNISIPLDPANTKTRIALFVQQGQAQADTLTVYHQNTPQFIDQACGFGMNYIIDSIHLSAFNIDSVKLVNPDVKLNEKHQHVQIIF